MRIEWMAFGLVAACSSSPGTTDCPATDGGESDVVATATDASPEASPPPGDAGGPGVYDSNGPAEWTDGGYANPTYTRGNAIWFIGPTGSFDMTCDGADTLVLSGSACAVDNGALASSSVTANTLTCVGTSDVPKYGATIVAVIECRRVF
jgi:hypothetical protein